jgi:hypothetical protein
MQKLQVSTSPFNLPIFCCSSCDALGSLVPPITLAFTRIYRCVSVTLREEQQRVFPPAVRTAEEFVALNPVRVGRQTFSLVEEKGVAIHRKKGRKADWVRRSRKIHGSVRPAPRFSSSRAISPTPRADSPAGLARGRRAPRSRRLRDAATHAAAAGAPQAGGTRATRSRWHRRVAPPHRPPEKDSVLLEGGR